MQEFTHVANYPDYMGRVERFVCATRAKGQTVLDMPAGNGLFAERLRAQGFEVTCGDFNREKPDFVYVNMELPLPFEDASFDVVTCMEGIEHVINPNDLVKELARIVKSGGQVVITMPNLQNFYSRLKFLFTGIFYQFEPSFSQHPRGRPIDRGHISSLSYTQLNYLFVEYGLEPNLIDGDKFKKKILFPVYAVLALFNTLYYKVKVAKKQSELPYARMANLRFFLSRSLIVGWTKP